MTPETRDPESREACAPSLTLASKSPRRRALLTEAGLAHRAMTPEIDDGELSPGSVEPGAWVEALAFLKARSIGQALVERAEEPLECSVVLGADTVCVVNGVVVGQPGDEHHARGMIRSLAGGEHEVLTGVALLAPQSGARTIFVDRATVRVGELSMDTIDAYLATGRWRGKAGGYNFAERVDAGWPLECEGDPTTVMGLPMRRLPGVLESFIARMTAAACGRCA